MKYSYAALSVFVALAAADEYSANGNTKTSIGGSSANAIKYGDQTPWSVVQTIAEHCSDGTCESDSWTIPTTFTDASAGTNTATNVGPPATITVSVADATYITWKKNALVDTLVDLAAIPELYSRTTEEITVCPENPDDLCDKQNIDQYSGPSTFYIRVNKSADDDSLTDFIRVAVSSGVDDDKFSETMCTVLTTAGAALASAMSAGTAAEAGMSLSSLICAAL